MTVKVFDFFSGCGGGSRGFQNAGMEIVFALDHDPDARRTFRANLPSAHFEMADIRNTSVEHLRPLVDAAKPSPILFCCCAPCQPFTKHNTTHPRQDDRVPLLTYFARFVESFHPDIVFVENVPGIQNFANGAPQFRRFRDRLFAAGYRGEYEPVPLMKYGVPQSRRRLIYLTSRHAQISLPLRTNGPEIRCAYETVRDWIGGLPPIRAGEEHATVSNHRAAGLSERNLERIRATPEGGGHRDWPSHLRLDCHERVRGYSDVYGRMSWDRPAPGLTTRCTSYSNGRFGHPQQDRAISVREAARLQTFPDDFVFEGSLASMSRQIGNAVPVRLAEIVGRHAIQHLQDVRVLR